MTSTVIVQIDIEGFHLYDGAPSVVEFLSNKHRHVFTIKAGYRVLDLNREKEIFICRDSIRHYLSDKYGAPCQFDGMSCEMIAKDIMDRFIDNDLAWCEVWEENTGGARVENDCR